MQIHHKHEVVEQILFQQRTAKITVRKIRDIYKAHGRDSIESFFISSMNI